jgi:hypothetical protein
MIVEYNYIKDNKICLVTIYKGTQLIFLFIGLSIPGIVKVCDVANTEYGKVYNIELQEGFDIIEVSPNFKSTNWNDLYSEISYRELTYDAVVRFVSYYFPKLAEVLNDKILEKSPEPYLDWIMKEQGVV